MPENDVKPEEKLYAGKFKTVEDLEAGYKASLPTFQENTDLKAKLEEATKIPDAYLNPSDADLPHERLTDLQGRAQDAGMTQGQYEKFLRGEKSRIAQQAEAYKAAEKAVGEETLNILKDYVSKNYPKELLESTLQNLVQSKEARQAALNHRDQILNNRVPGINNVGAQGYTVTDKDVREAYQLKEKSKSRRDIDRYLALVAQQAVSGRPN